MTTIPTNVLKAMLTHAGKKDIRYYLNGVFVDRTSGHVVATDGHRMLIVKLDVGAWEAGKSYIMPRDALAAALKLNSGLPDILIDDSAAPALVVGGVNCTAIDGRYPEWRRVVPLRMDGGFQAGNAFDPTYLCEAYKALATISGRPVSHAWLSTDSNNNCGVVSHPDVAGFSVVMAMRADTLTGEDYRQRMAFLTGQNYVAPVVEGSAGGGAGIVPTLTEVAT